VLGVRNEDKNFVCCINAIDAVQCVEYIVSQSSFATRFPKRFDVVARGCVQEKCYDQHFAL
jgi:hypothetical protein